MINRIKKNIKDILFLIGILIIILTTTFLNIYIAMYLLGISLIVLAIFLFKTEVRK